MGERKVIMERDQKGRFAKRHRAWNKGKRLPQVSSRMREFWGDPEYRARQVKAHKHANPEHSSVMKNLWKDPEYGEKQRIKHLGHKLSEETREKISESLRRIKIPEEELRRLYLHEKLSTVKIAENYGISHNTVLEKLEEHGIRVRTKSEALKGKIIGKRVRDKISKAKKGQRSSPDTEFTSEGVKGEKNPFYGKRHSKETKRRISLTKQGVPVHSEEFKRELSIHWRKLWANPDFREKRVKKVVQSLMEKPTKPEQRLIHIIESHDLPFQYVGDGEVIIAGRNPDFIHADGEKKVIEVFGRVFHDPNETFLDEIPWNQTYEGKMKAFRLCGYDCLIIWDDELEDEGKVVERITSWA